MLKIKVKEANDIVVSTAKDGLSSVESADDFLIEARRILNDVADTGNIPESADDLDDLAGAISSLRHDTIATIAGSLRQLAAFKRDDG